MNHVIYSPIFFGAASSLHCLKASGMDDMCEQCHCTWTEIRYHNPSVFLGSQMAKYTVVMMMNISYTHVNDFLGYCNFYRVGHVLFQTTYGILFRNLAFLSRDSTFNLSLAVVRQNPWCSLSIFRMGKPVTKWPHSKQKIVYCLPYSDYFTRDHILLPQKVYDDYHIKSA